MKWEHKALGVGVLAVIGILGGVNLIEQHQADTEKAARAAKIAALPKPPPPKTDAERFTERRETMIAALRETFKTKVFYEAVRDASEFEKVADAAFVAELNKVREFEKRHDAENLRQADAARAVAIIKDKAEAKKRGVSIGMTRDQVLGSSWGRPQHVNTTTSVRGTREQWVYGGRNYLYFENGILTTIQN